MNTNYHKLIGVAGVIFGICNLVPIVAETQWYRIFCFALLGVPSVVFGVFCFRSKKTKMVRAQGWINFLSGCCILFLALSSFYASETMAEMNFIAATGLIASGLIGLYGSTKKLGLTLVP